MKVQKQIQTELKKLTDFGLNPLDWNLEPVHKKIFRLVHKEDSSFILKGYYENQSWKKIWLQSI